jgi:hypothetical protein
MGQDPGQERTQLTGDPAERAAALRTEIEETREELGDTAAALAAKTDVKARAQDRADELKARAKAKADEIRENPAPAIAAGAVVATVAIIWLARRRSRSARGA